MNNFDLIQRNETNSKSMGGTELLQNRLYDGSVPRELLEQFQIIFSRVRELDESKYRILYCHDLPADPESEAAFSNNGHERFHRIVFVSNWQMQAYIGYYDIPWSKCLVIPNSIHPIAMEEKNNGPSKFYGRDNPYRETRLIYTSTPHRGLNILYPVFDALCKKYEGLVLDVYSSFKLYGWEQRDVQYTDLFEKLKAHPNVNYYGTASNDEVRSALEQADIFAYPSIWQETSCLCLIEAMSAGLLCVHPNYGALYETAGSWTMQYQWDEDVNRHANIFYGVLDHAISTLAHPSNAHHLNAQIAYTNNFHDWKNRANDWTSLLQMIVNSNPPKSLPSNTFTYNV